jgi:hypothetical protein
MLGFRAAGATHERLSGTPQADEAARAPLEALGALEARRVLCDPAEV